VVESDAETAARRKVEESIAEWLSIRNEGDTVLTCFLISCSSAVISEGDRTSYDLLSGPGDGQPIHSLIGVHEIGRRWLDDLLTDNGEED
jgi:hypothetical protein